MSNRHVMSALLILLALLLMRPQSGVAAEFGVEELKTRFLVQMVSRDGESCVLLDPALSGDDGLPKGSALVSRPVSCRRLPDMSNPAVTPEGVKFQVYFQDENSREWTPVAADSARLLPILIPYATEALRLQGLEASRFLRFDQAAAHDPVVRQELNASDYRELLALVRGSSGLYQKSSPNGTVLPSLANPPSAPVAGQLWYDTQSKSVRLFDGTSYQELGSGKGGGVFGQGVISITAGTGLTGGTITRVGTIALESYGIPGSYYKVNTDKHGRVSSGSTALVESDIPNLRTAGKVSGDAITSGTIAGATSVNTTGTVTATSVSANSLRGQTVFVFNAANTSKVGVQAASSLAADFNLTLPASLPAEAGQVLASDTTGHLSWVTVKPSDKIQISGQLPIEVADGAGLKPVISVRAATTSSLGVAQLAPLGGTVAGTVVQANDPRLADGRAPSGRAGGDLAGSYPNPTVARVQGVAVQAGTPYDGQAWKFVAATGTWTHEFFGAGDLKNDAGRAQIPRGCSAAQTMLFNSVSDQFDCVNIAIAHTAVSGLGDAATKDVGNTAGTVAAGDDSRFGNAQKIQGREVINSAPAGGQVLTWNAANNRWEPQTPASAPVTSVAGRTGAVVLSTADISGLGSAATRNVATAGDASATQVVLGNDSRLSNGRPASGPAGGDLAGTYPNPTVARVQGVAVEAGTPVDGQAFKFVEATGTWAHEFLGAGELKNRSGRAQIPTGCSAAQTLLFNAISDQFDCVNIAIAHTAVSGLGSAAIKDVGNTAGTVAAGDDARFGNAQKIQGREVVGSAPAGGQVLTWNAANNRWEPQTPASAPVTSVAGRTGAVVLSIADISGLGSAATRNVAATGDASATQVVLGNDSRLTNGRPASGPAGGDLVGSYPNPELVAIGQAGLYYRVQTDGKGRVISGQAQLTPQDIPGLDWSQIVSGWPTTLAGYKISDAVQNAGGTPSVQTGVDSAKGPGGVAGRVYIATDTSKIYSDNGSQWTVVASQQGSGGTLTSITAGNGLLGGTITASGVISADVGVTANKLVQLDGSARLPMVDGSQLTQLNASSLASGTVAAARLPAFTGDVTSSAGSTNLTVAKLQGRTLNAQNAASGSYLKFDGSQWLGASLHLADLKSTVSGNLFNAPNCSSSQTLSWSSVTDQFNCIAINISDAAIAYRSQAANTVFAAPAYSAGTPQFRLLTAADLPAGAYDGSYFKNGGNAFGQTAVLGTKDAQALQLATGGVVRMTLDTYGNVGIGTGTPQAALDVRGAVRVGNDVTCFAAKAGTIRWTGTSFQGCDGTQWVALSSAGSTAPAKPGYGYQLNKTNATYTATIPWSDTIPANTQGSEILTATITPTSSNSLIEVNALVHYAQPTEISGPFTLAAFQDAGTRAFATAATNITGANCGQVSESALLCQAKLSTVFVAGTTSPIVIRVRAGLLQGTWELNGSGGRKLGGTLASSLILREVLQ